MRFSTLAAVVVSVTLPLAASAADFETRPQNQGQWLIYDGEPKTALLVPAATVDPQCYQIAEVYILLENAQQALNQNTLLVAARRGLENYQSYCAAKGQRASNARNFVAFVEAEAEPDSLGRIESGSAVASGVIRTTGVPSDGVLETRFNRARAGAEQSVAQEQAANARAALEREQGEARAEREAQSNEHVERVKAKYGPRFSDGRAAAKYTGNMFSPDRVKITGAWSSSRAQCGEDVLMLIDNDGSGRVEWWRATKSYGMLPFRIGLWALGDDIITMDFTHRVESTFIGGFKDEPYNETVQLNLVNVSSNNLRLSSPGPNSPALRLLGADEKQFVRCTRS